MVPEIFRYDASGNSTKIQNAGLVDKLEPVVTIVSSIAVDTVRTNTTGVRASYSRGRAACNTSGAMGCRIDIRKRIGARGVDEKCQLGHWEHPVADYTLTGASRVRARIR